MKKTQPHILTIFTISTTVFFFLGLFLGYSYHTPTLGEQIIEPQEIKKIIENFQKPPSEETLLDTLMHAYVDAYGDKYTQYFSPDELLSFQTMIDGDFEGIGAYVEDDVNGIYISGVLPGSPAQESGLLPGDIIQAVNGETMHTKTANDAVRKIRGPAGTAVVLQIFSSIMGTRREVTLLRRHLEIPVIQDSLHDNTLVIQLFSFNDHSRDDVVKSLQKYSGKYKNILLDLRYNGGGTLESAVDVGSLFLARGKLIARVDGDSPATYISHGDNDLETPLFLLVNGQTASAAEILTSTLHIHLDAPIFGSQTYGKGSVQQLFPLSNGGEVKVTIAKWRTADNILIDGVGIAPTTQILPTVQDIIEGKDEQLEKALTHIKKTNK